MMTCEEISDLLSAWLDREIEAPVAEQVRMHLERCPTCLAQKERLEFLDVALKRALASRSAEVTFDGIWSGVERKIQVRVPWYQRLWDRHGFEFLPMRPAWVLSFSAALLLGLFFLVRYFPDWRANNNYTFVESIDAHGSNVALFREAETRTTVIWLFEDLENQNEVPEESPTNNVGF